MSLYNMLHGQQPESTWVLEALGLKPNKIPRYRDAWIDVEAKALAIHTRTGGGNRDYYDHPDRYEAVYGDDPVYMKDPYRGPWNQDLRDLPTFKYERDDEFDYTYATFYFDIPEGIELPDGVKTPASPAERWQAVFDALTKAKSDG